MRKKISKFYKHILLFIFLSAIGHYIINITFEDKKEQYLSMQSQLLQTKYDTNYKYFKIMSQDIYSIYSENQLIVAIFSKASKANEERRSELREKLYKLLQKRYKRLKKMGVKQLHFHLSDNTSFLRMHQREKFGDNLTEIKNNVVQTNKNEEFTEGFEVGKYTHGFRFVYPFYNEKKEHIGSVEISFSSEKLLENIMDNYIFDAHFLVSKDELDKNTWGEKIDKYYESSWETPDFLLEHYTHTTAGDIDLYNKLESDLVAKDIAKHMNEDKGFATYTTYNYNTVVLNFVPIINAKNKIVAYIVTYTESDYIDNVIIQEEYSLILHYATLLLLFVFGFYVISNKVKLKELAHFDTLTKLPNRSFFYIEFENEINRASRHNNKLAVLFIDLDGFKAVNDTYGHNVGDQLLIEVAKRLKSVVRVTDVVARLGGDEFTIILSDLKHKEEALKISEKIIKTLNKDFIINKKIMNIGASIGIAVYPEHGKDMDTLIQIADDMMYKAKNNGKNNAVIYKCS